MGHAKVADQRSTAWHHSFYIFHRRSKYSAPRSVRVISSLIERSAPVINNIPLYVIQVHDNMMNDNTMGAPILVLNVAEKPSVARALAAVFSSCPGAQDRPSHSRHAPAPLFETDQVHFPCIFTQGHGQLPHNHLNVPTRAHTMITTSVRGHLASQDFGPQYGWNSCSPQDLFHAPIETLYRPDMEPLEKMIQEQARRVHAVILWLDCDREGEAISDEVRTVCLRGNPRLRMDRIYRAKFSTVLPQEIQRALRSLGRVNENFVQAVQARCELDLRVGAAFTRFQTLRLQKKFQEFSEGGVISYGPCQFPTLGFVVERWARIETFIPEEFWYLEMTMKVNGDPSIQTHAPSSYNSMDRPIHLKWKRERLYDRTSTMALYENCLEVGEGFVTGMNGRQKNKWRPIPLATVELQKRAARYLRIGSESLMTAAEELYQHGFISYPRTETEKFRPEFEHMPLIQSFQGIPGVFGEYATKLLSGNFFQYPRAGPHDDNAHPPITPCRAVDPQTIQDPVQRDVYILIVKHYLACCSRDAIGYETTITVRIATEDFYATGLMISERNWLEIYTPWERWYTDQGELPTVEVGTRIRPLTLIMRDGKTTAPLPLSEVELITLMDRNGIGTDATIASHITTILDREYATKDAQQRFHPTKLGIALIEGYNSMGYQLNKPDLRRETEAQCNAVANGLKTKEEIMTIILTKMHECFITASTEAVKLDEAVARHFTRIGSNVENFTLIAPSFSICGSCNGSMALRQGQQNPRSNNQQRNVRSKLLVCQLCSFACRLPRGIPVAVSDNRTAGPQLCPICKYQVIKMTEGDGYVGNGYTLCPKCFMDPPAEHGGATLNDFPCYKCNHPSCTLASGIRGGDVEVYPCPFCDTFGMSGKTFLKKNNRGFVLSCSNYATANTGAQRRCEYTVWLPKEASSITIPDAVPGTNSEDVICSRCSKPNALVRKIHFTWKVGSVPPHYDREVTSCILCDDLFQGEILKINFPQLGQVRVRTSNDNFTGRTARGRARSSDQFAGRGRNNRTNQTGNTRSNHTGRSNGHIQNTALVCFKCGRAGHFASACTDRA